MKKALHYTGITLSILALCPALLWCLGLWIYQPISLIPTVVTVGIWLFLYLKRPLVRKHIMLSLWALFAVNVLCYQFIPGPQPEQWQTPWAQEPQFSLSADGRYLTIHNLRDFKYLSEEEYTPHYRTETYDLDTLTGVDFAASHWDGMQTICHTMMSFGFADGRRLVVSAETRLPVGEEQSAIGGLYKRYGLLYVFGTEEDLFALRTNYRHEDLMLIPLKAKPEKVRDMLLHFVKLQQEASANHTAYNTIADNCSTGIINTFRSIAPNMPWYYNLLPVHNGDIVKVLYRHGAVQTRPDETLEDFCKRCYLGYDPAPAEPVTYSEGIRAKINR